MTNQDTWQVRAIALELAAFSFRYPDEALAGAVLSGEWADAAEEIMEALETEIPEGFADAELALDKNGEAVEDVEAFRHTLCAEATRLFVGAPNAAVSPYEGVWRAKDDGVLPLLFVNPHSMAVERYLKSCGLGQPEGTNEPLDHAATELEFLQYLAALEAGISEPLKGAKAAAKLPGGSPAAAFDAFVEEHTKTWMPRFAEAVAAETRLPYYRAAAQFLGAILTTL